MTNAVHPPHRQTPPRRPLGSAGPGRLAAALLVLGAAASAQSGFESGFYKPLDLQRAAQQQYGSKASVTSVGNHLYDWRAKVGFLLFPLDLQRAVTEQYGSSWTLVSVGVHRNDWRAVRFADLERWVLPVVPVASDRFDDIDGVRTGLARYRSVLAVVQSWYAARAGTTFRLLQPLVVPSSLTEKQWNALSASTSNPSSRYVLLDAAENAYDASLPPPHKELRVALSPYVGDAPNVWLGAAARGRFALAPQRATSLACPATGPLGSLCADAAYAVGHELGHAFGLGHACEDYPTEPQCGLSIMEAAKPRGAILLEPEIVKLMRSGMFPGTATAFGSGCAGSYGVVQQSWSGLPRVGGQQRFRLDNAPPSGAAVFVLGLSNRTWNAFQLPWGIPGAPGCMLYTEPLVHLTVPTNLLGSATFVLNHPASSTFVGTRFFTQFIALDPPANRLGATYTNGIATRLGSW